MSISSVILAGGQSRRLGQDKAFVEVGGQPLIERVLQVVRALSDDVVIVTNDPARYERLGVRLVGDIYPGKASLGGIYTGLASARAEQALVVGCDMPFLNLGLLRHMIRLAAGYAVVIPRYDGYLEPLHAIYHRRCLPTMQAHLEADELRIAEVLAALPARYVSAAEIDLYDPERLTFFNINTPEDLARAQMLAQLLDRQRALELQAESAPQEDDEA